MYAEDVLVLIYPNLKNIEQVVIVDPFDHKIKSFSVSSIEEVKEVLRDNLPFCFQHNEPIMHFGSVYILEWEGLTASEIEIHSPQDIERVLG